MTPELLKKRLQRFFSYPANGRYAVFNFIEELYPLGKVVVIGGMPRDIALGGSKEFSSDIDLVIDPNNLHDFQLFMEGKAAKQNKFGGYGTIIGKWRVDIWPLEKTWAKVEGLSSVDKFEDLLKVTFFNWDAILYDIKCNKVIASKDYFDHLNDRYLDINLITNPNPLGCTIRAIKAAHLHNAKFSYQLAVYVYENLREYKRAIRSYMERKMLYFPQEQLDIVVEHLYSYLKENTCTPCTFLKQDQRALSFYTDQSKGHNGAIAEKSDFCEENYLSQEAYA